MLERHATHILIVSDAPGRNHWVNRQLEAEVGRLDAAFSVTEPLAVVGHAEGSSGWPPLMGTDDRVIAPWVADAITACARSARRAP